MALFSFEHASTGRHSSFVDTIYHGADSLRVRAVASWRRHRAERALEGLSYDTLKDIGFPSAETVNEDKPTR